MSLSSTDPHTFVVNHALVQRSTNFFCKETDGQYIYILGFTGHTVPQLLKCICSTKAAMDNKKMNEHRCVLIKLYLWTVKSEYRIFWCVTKSYSPPTIKNSKSQSWRAVQTKTGAGPDLMCRPSFADLSFTAFTLDCSTKHQMQTIHSQIRANPKLSIRALFSTFPFILSPWTFLF